MMAKQRRRGGVLNVRERGSDDRRWWSPDRDLTVVFPRTLRRVFHELSTCLSVDDQSFHQAAFEVAQKLNVTSDEIALMAQSYGKLVQCIQTRRNATQAVAQLNSQHFYVQALIGLLFLQHLSFEFADKYMSTLHKGEPDDNADALEELLDSLRSLPERTTWWRRLWKRVRLMWAILHCPLIGTGRCSAKP